MKNIEKCELKIVDGKIILKLINMYIRCDKCENLNPYSEEIHELTDKDIRNIRQRRPDKDGIIPYVFIHDFTCRKCNEKISWVWKEPFTLKDKAFLKRIKLKEGIAE